MWLWKCLVCEKDLTPDADWSGDDDQGSLPNLEGGTIDINFGYGSRFDDVNVSRRIQHQACICDDCYEKKMGLTRAVMVTHTQRWDILVLGYRDQKRQQDV